MSLGLKMGDKVRVLKGKFKGQEDVVFAIDKKNKRIHLAKLKKTKADKKELHGTFHLSSLFVIRPEKKVEEPTAAPVEPATEKTEKTEIVAKKAQKDIKTEAPAPKEEKTKPKEALQKEETSKKE